MEATGIYKRPDTYSRMIVGLLSVFGLAGILPVSIAELSSGTACPHLGPVPACHIVLIGYCLILASVIRQNRWNNVLFYLGWFPVYLLAATGSLLELMGHETCPRTDGGWPKCYSSLMLILVIILPRLVGWFRSRA